jgi:hypothetical protein
MNTSPRHSAWGFLRRIVQKTDVQFAIDNLRLINQKPQILTSQIRPGYVFLLSVLFIGAMAMTTATTLVILGIAAQKNGLAFTQSTQALHNAQTCIERTLRFLRADTGYTGNATFTLPQGSCTILTVAGTGNVNRILCARGEYGNSTRRIEVFVATLLPSSSIASWQEPSTFTLCTE